MTSTLVEKMLPARLLVNVGIYLQSAAHLELAIWQIVMLADEIDETSREEFLNSLEVKNVTRKLVGELRKCSVKCKPKLGIRISRLAQQIEKGLENRNLAAHGAFYIDEKSNSIRVAHYFPRGKKPSRDWLEYRETIQDRAIKTAIEEIDLLLREAVNIRSELEHEKRKNSQKPPKL